MKRKEYGFLLICLLTLSAAVLTLECLLKRRKEEPSTVLRIGTARMEGDSTRVRDAAIFLCNEKDSAYNDCECSQNIPLIEGVAGPEPVETQDIYASHAAMVYAYAPYRSGARVDSLHWDIEDFEPLLVAAPQLVTSHFPEINLGFRPVLGQLSVLLDGKPCPEYTLEGSIPLEGSLDLLTGSLRPEKTIGTLHVSSERQYLLPSPYQDMKIRIGEKTIPAGFAIEAGKTTRILCHAHDKGGVDRYDIW